MTKPTGSQLQYKVFITPLISKNTYGNEIDVTQDIDISEVVTKNGIGKISQQIDNGDYEFGVFTYSDLQLTAINRDGRFSDENSYDSIFRFKRDKAKIRVDFVSQDNTVTINFKGIINEEATREDVTKGLIKFRVLSNSSIFRKTKVSGGSIANGTTFKNALFSILNNTDITAILNLDIDNIEVGIDLIIDDGSAFDNLVVQEALNQLLVASSSVLFVDDDDNIIITTRNNDNTTIYRFFGGQEVFGRENILKLQNYNNGLHRLFNSVSVNNDLSEDPISININDLKRKNLSFNFITTELKNLSIANRILDDFKNLRAELEIKIRTNDSLNIKLLDNVVVELTNLNKPAGDKEFFPQYGINKYGEDFYPYINNPVPIRKNQIFRVIGIFEDPKNFITTLKLRASGNFILVAGENLPVYGEAVYGEQVYQ